MDIKEFNGLVVNYQCLLDVFKDCIILVIGVGVGIGWVVVLVLVVYGVIVILLGCIQSKLEVVYDKIKVVGGLELVLVLVNMEVVWFEDYQELVILFG